MYNTITKKIKRALRYCVHDRAQLMNSLLSNFFTWIPDKLYLQLMFRFSMGYWPDFKKPKTFNEKLNWLKLYNRKPEYTKMVDKLSAKNYVANIIGPEYLIPTIDTWVRTEDINWESLPNKFVLKTTHGGGSNGVIICKDLNNFDKQQAIKKLNTSLRQDIYKKKKEWPYKDVAHRIIAEQFLEDKDNEGDLHDYKFFCFNGKVKFFKIDFDRTTNHHANYYDLNGELQPFGENSCPPIPQKHLNMPSQLVTMVELAEKLSKGMPFLRVDFYEVNNNIYFGELTFYPASGMGKWIDETWDFKFGSWLTLPEIV